MEVLTKSQKPLLWVQQKYNSVPKEFTFQINKTSKRGKYAALLFSH